MVLLDDEFITDYNVGRPLKVYQPPLRYVARRGEQYSIHVVLSVRRT